MGISTGQAQQWRETFARVSLIAAAGLTLAFAIVTLEPAPGELGEQAARLANVTVGLLCAAVCIASARRGDGDDRGWLAIGVGIASWSAGNAYFTLASPAGGALPVPSAADALWLPLYPLVLAGLLVIGRTRILHPAPAMLLDGAIGWLACGAAFAAMLLTPLADAAGSGDALLASAINLAYPVGDLILLTLVLGLLLTGPVRWTGAVVAGVAGLGLFAIADTTFMVQSARGAYSAGEALDVVWLVALTLVACAARDWRPLPPPDPARRRLGAPLGTSAASAVIALAVLLAGLVSDRVPVVASLLAAAALALTIVRLLVATRGNHTMLAELRDQAVTDTLTGLGNRRRLFEDLGPTLATATAARPVAVVVLDLDGFKTYNDTFGHAAGDRLLARIARALRIAVTGTGFAYRLGGDEFCALIDIDGRDADEVARGLAGQIAQHGLGFSVTASYGCATFPGDGANGPALIRRADRRMYERKNDRRPSAAAQATEALLALVHERYPHLDDHNDGVTSLARRVGERLGLIDVDLDAVACAAALHDVGKIAIPDTILNKPGPLDDEEWELMRRHTEIGERVMRAVPALRKAAPLVRWSHERWDGGGYPDGLSGRQIPLGASIVAACDAFDAMTEDRSYQAGRPTAEALAELRRCAGTQFRADVVEALGEIVAADRAASVVPRSGPGGKAPMPPGAAPTMFAR